MTARLFAPLATLASEAGARILQCAAEGLAPRAKPDHSPVTVADETAEEILRAGLAQILPGVPVVSEEGVGRGETFDVAAEFLLVDPIDGTREFIAGKPEYTVNIALIAAGSPMLGLIYAPALRMLYAGAQGRAFKVPLAPGSPFEAAATETIRARPRPPRLVAAVSRSHPDPASEALLSTLPVELRLVLGSALKFARLAEGVADVYPRFAPIHEWDVAAGHALLAAAGGTVTAPNAGILRYGRRNEGFRMDGFLAWGAPPGPLSAAY
jgi:3'(2'), 5'-bisphosphate nucleotidase